jgi:hypothetical protein
MKLEVWTGPEPKEEEPTRVRLMPTGSGGIDLCAVDAKGELIPYGTIASLNGKGLIRCSCLSRDVGFPLDKLGRILDI